MNTNIAKRVGSRQAIKAVIIGLIIAYLIMSMLSYNPVFPSAFWLALMWIKDINYSINLFVAAVLIFIIGYLLGQRAGVDILIKNRNRYWAGIKCGLLVLWGTTFLTGIFGVIQNPGDQDNVLVDYIVKPLFWVTFFGFIPAIIVGIWFGYSIGRKKTKE